MSAPFEERSGVVPCGTPWGRWYQTLEEVFVEVRVPPGTRAKDVRCSLQSRHIALSVGGQEVLQVPAAPAGSAARRRLRRRGERAGDRGRRDTHPPPRGNSNASLPRCPFFFSL